MNALSKIIVRKAIPKEFRFLLFGVVFGFMMGLFDWGESVDWPLRYESISSPRFPWVVGCPPF